MRHYKHFKHLNVPDHWQHYWSKYPHGYTIMEALISWVSQVDQMTDNLNSWNTYLDQFVSTFDTKLQGTVREMVQELYDSGKLAELTADVIAAVQDQIEEIDDRLTTQLEETTTDIVDRGINVRKFGAVGDGVTDDSQAIQEANDYCLEHGLMMFSNSKHFLAESVTINCNANLENATFLFDGRQDKSVKIVSYDELPDDVRVTSKKIRLPFIKNINFTDTGYPSLEQTAVYIRGLSRSKVHFNEIWGFKTGVHLESDDTKYSIAWSDFIFSFFLNNETSLLIEQSGTGWINSNTFTSFGASQYSNTNRNVNNNLIVNSEKAGATGFDNNVFIACDFEDRTPRDVDTYAVTLKNMTNTVFLGCRWEMANKNFVKIDGGHSNIFIGGYNLNPAYIREENNPKYALYWQDRITTSGRIESKQIIQGKGLTSIGDRVLVRDGTVYPIWANNTDSDYGAYVRLDVAENKVTGQMEYHDGKVAWLRKTEGLSNGKFYTRVDATDRLKIVSGDSFEIESASTTINNNHIQTTISCSTAERPDVKQRGMMVFDTDLNKPIFGVSAGVWVDATGNQV